MEGTALDPVLRTLPACPRLRTVVVMNRCASIGAMRALLQLTKDTHSTLETDHWLAVAYDAFCDMLRVNTSPVLELPPFNDTFIDERLIDSRNQMRIEQVLNLVGRGRLLSSRQTTRKELVDALHKLNSYSNVDESPEFSGSCMYSLL
jgi:hypothetical protein